MQKRFEREGRGLVEWLGYGKESRNNDDDGGDNETTTTSNSSTSTTAMIDPQKQRSGRALPLAAPLAPLVLSGGITLGKESLK